MPYKVPTFDQFTGFLVSLAKALLPDRNFGSRFAPGWKLVRTFAGVGTDVNAHVDAAARDVSPLYAIDAALDRQLSIWRPGGLSTRKPATPARKAAAGRVRGTTGSTSAVGDQLIHRATGLLFQINSAVTIPAGVNPYLDADILAISTGSQTRLRKGEVLEYLNTPAGIQTQVELQSDLDNDGYDTELNGDARNRLLLALGTPAAGGNQTDYVSWLLAQTGIAQAFCYPGRAGLGTIDVIGFHSGSGINRFLTGPEQTAVMAVLSTLAPAQVAAAALRYLTAVGGNTDAANLANVEMTITPDGQAQNAFDWNDTTPGVVLSYNAATRTLQFTGGARPATLQAGHRIVLKGVASSQDGTPMTVLALSGADSIILQDTPTVSPAATDIVYAGGPLTKKIRDAIIAHINGDTLYAASTGPLPAQVAASQSISTVNLQTLARGIGPANPGGVYGAWSGTLMTSVLAKIATFTPGVFNQRVITPAADQDAVDYAFPLDAQIGLLTPGYVLVRKG